MYPILVMVLGRVIDDRLLHQENTKSSICVTLSGIVIVVSPLQFWNAVRPIEISEFGKSTEIKRLQSQNAISPIFVTELGMEMDFIVEP